MSRRYCCVVECKNTTKNSACKFYMFPTAPHKLEQRKQWIAAVKRKNADGSPWMPKRFDYICSDHFIGNKKREEINSPSYVPTIFPWSNPKGRVNEMAAMNRHARYVKRKINSMKSKIVSGRKKVLEQPFKLNEETRVTLENVEMECNINQTIDRGCQATSFINEDFDRTFICNRIGFAGEAVWDVEIQTNINDNLDAAILPKRKEFENKQSRTEPKNYEIKNEDSNSPKVSGSDGLLSIIKEEVILDFAE